MELFIPHPVRGMTTENFYANPLEGWARFLRNWIVKVGSLRQRPCQTTEAALSQPGGVSARYLIWHDHENNQYMWDNGLIENAAGTDLYTGTIQSYQPYEGRFKDQVYLSRSGQATIRRNGTSGANWGTFPFTLDTLTSSEIRGSCGYRGRAYFWGTDATDGSEIIEYGPLDSISGNTAAFTIGAFLEDGETVKFCSAANIKGESSQLEMFCIYCDSGRVLVYSGDDPEANNWFFEGSYNMTPPLSEYAWAKVQGDILVMGEEYIYSTRAMYANASKAAEENSITAPIARLYQQAAELARLAQYPLGSFSNTDYPFAYFHEALNVVIFQLGFADDVMYSWDENQRLQLVYCRETGGLAFWDVPQLRWPVKLHGGNGADRKDPVWVYGKTVLRLSYRNTFSTDSVADLAGSAEFSQGPNVELVWSTPMLTALQNAQINGLRPSLQQDDLAQGSTFWITSCGVIGEGTDFELNDYQGTFIRDEDADINSLTSLTRTTPSGGIIAQTIISPELNVNLNAQHMHATYRINEMETSSVNPSLADTQTRRNEVFGMKIYYEQGDRA